MSPNDTPPDPTKFQRQLKLVTTLGVGLILAGIVVLACF
jgi:hypothetical protein